MGHQSTSSFPIILEQAAQRPSWIECGEETGMGAVLVGMPPPYHFCYVEKRAGKTCAKALSLPHTTTAKEMVPNHPSVRSLLGSMDEEILKLAEEVYWGQCGAVPSILTHQHQDQFMDELH